MKRKAFLLRCFGVLVVCLAIACPVPAQALLDDKKYSESEKVGFAFYHLGKIKPEFSSWVRGSDAYKKANESEKSQIMQKEEYRLTQGYYSYTLAEDYILVRTPVEYRFKDMGDQYTGSDQWSGKVLEIVIPGLSGPYFPFQLANTWVAVIAKDYEYPIRLPLSQADLQQFAKKFGEKAIKGTRPLIGEVDIYLRPVSVNAATPVTIEGRKMWLMLAEVGSMVVWQADRGAVAWQFNLAWFRNRGDKDILDLYRD